MKYLIIGVDEAGRGAWAGPVVAACVYWNGNCPIRGILNDSKKMTASSRELLYQEIVSLSLRGKLFYAVGTQSNTIIDTQGIREANRLAMQEALEKMKNEEGTMNYTGIRLLIDGRDNYQFDILGLPTPEYIVRGDSKIKQIMAASIIAKVTRDTLMRGFDVQFPGYEFGRHNGYGTTFHQIALQKLGVCEIHRKSYSPISILL